MPLLRAEFEDLVRQHHAAVFRTAARLLPTADAEDVTQNVFTELWLGRARVGDQAGNNLRWLAGRFALNVLRSRRRRVHHEALAAPRDPSGAAPDAEALAAVRGALGMLPADLRAAVVLRYQEDLTFDGIAVALRCSESTAHDRVRRGLDKLRHLLTRAGFAAVAARLPTALPKLAVTPVPPTLAARLDAVPELCLAPAGAAVASTSLAMPLATLAVIALAAGAWWFARERAQVARAHAAAAYAAAAAALPPALTLVRPPSEPAESRQLINGALRLKVADTATARAVGVVFDKIDGRRIAGATVQVYPIEVSKAGNLLVQTHTDADGRFELAWPCTDIGCCCLITAPGYEGFLHRDDHCAPGAPLDLRVALVRRSEQPWATRVRVRDSEGLPVVNAVVSVFCRSSDGILRETWTDEEIFGLTHDFGDFRNKTDVQGIARVTEKHVGEKILVVQATESGHAAVARRFAVDSATVPELELTLPRGRTVTGIVRDVATRQPAAQLLVVARQTVADLGELATSIDSSDAQGRFELKGCSAGAISLSGNPLVVGTWSPFAAVAFAADVTDVELWVKRRDDPTAAGLHLGEVHGHCLDATTGAPLRGQPAVETVRIPDGVVDWRAHVLESVLNPLQTFTDTEDERSAPPPQPPTDAVHVVGLTEGQHALVVRMPDRAPAIVGPFAGGLGQLQRDVPIRIGAGGTVTITVSDPRGAQVANANAWLTADADAVTAARAPVDAMAKRERPRHLRTTVANKPTVYDRVPAGVTLRAIAATARGFAVSAPFVLRDGDQHEIQLRLDG